MSPSATATLPAVPAAEKRTTLSSELDWFLANFDELLAKYPEQWLIISDQEVVMNATSPADLRDKLKACGIHRPFIGRTHPDAWLRVK